MEEYRDNDVAWAVLESTINKAVDSGNHEIIEDCIKAYPSTIWVTASVFYLFHLAIHERQERVYNLVYQMGNDKSSVASYVDPETRENALHIVAKLAPARRLKTVTGAALQMQRELQWFNEWMKGTASSSTIVAALIVTVAFAAAFTVPGGNINEGKDEGKPVYLNNGAFMVFIISDAVALFSSVTSVLMFVGILTSRYAEDDFLYTLPKRMTIGLISSFLSLTATVVAFGATLSLVLLDKVKWIIAPLVIMACIPVALYALLQFPLLYELLNNTYGRSIFHRENRRMIH
ncbi:hypothetical protein OSB04_010287 [Centaurea solstitialis]|uniref:PGG domain-containing protein n=1 Tax=Centaurea solstitialis TaxID=347529 RepID=A0AA38T791_9ASTR|nr:hypothetical protein OSB04_010287 [Centaurea solstitialis]